MASLAREGHAVPKAEPRRCAWCGEDPLLVEYHDTEWGVPSTDDRHLFELLTLEGAQAGLSWITILRKRDAYRAAFADFDVDQVARFDDQRVSLLRQDAGIVRNRAKIESTVSNARAVLSLREEGRTLKRFLWDFVDGSPVQNAYARGDEIPAQTAQSRAMSAALKKRGFKFCGPTICYALMQAAGLVNDHVTDCVRYAELS